METKRIGIAVVLQNDQVLVGIRDKTQVLAGLHEFPGGKCEADESPEACTIRECREETGLEVSIRRPLFQTLHDYPHGRVELFFFECTPSDSSETPLLGNFQWVSRADLTEMTFPEANRPVVQLLSQA